jgi:hypothetical protein
VFLGYERPMALRPAPGDRFLVVGHCYVHGLQDASALFGPLPSPWKVVSIHHPANVDQLELFIDHPQNDKYIVEDP